jgi:ABC-type glycerol-3-phosphate transport system substrate-binding protein
VVVLGSDYASKLRSAIGSSAAPDVFFNWGGGSIEPYVQANQLVDLTPYFNEAPLEGAFLPSVVAAGAINGRDYQGLRRADARHAAGDAVLQQDHVRPVRPRGAEHLDRDADGHHHP